MASFPHWRLVWWAWLPSSLVLRLSEKRCPISRRQPLYNGVFHSSHSIWFFSTILKCKVSWKNLGIRKNSIYFLYGKLADRKVLLLVCQLLYLNLPVSKTKTTLPDFADYIYWISVCWKKIKRLITYDLTHISMF